MASIKQEKTPVRVKKAESSPKVSSHIFRNTILTLLCFPPLFGVFAVIKTVFLLWPNRQYQVMLIPVICLLLVGIVIAVVCGRLVKNKLGSGHIDSARRISTKTKKGYVGITVILWLFMIFLAVFMPAHSYYLHPGYLISASDKLIQAQEEYHQNNKTFTLELDKLPGWDMDPEIYDVIIHRADSQCWSATIKVKTFSEGSRFFTYDHCGEGLTVRKSSN